MKYEASQEDLTKLMAQNFEMQSKVSQEAEASQKQEAEEGRKALEAQFEKQVSEYKHSNADLKEKVGALEVRCEDYKAQLDERDIELQNVKTDLDNNLAAVENLRQQLASLEEERTKKTDVERKTRIAEQATKQHLQTYSTYRSKKQDEIRSMLQQQKELISSITGTNLNEDDTKEKKVHPLQDSCDRLRDQVKALQTQLKKANAEALSHKKIAQKRIERIKDLEARQLQSHNTAERQIGDARAAGYGQANKSTRVTRAGVSSRQEPAVYVALCVLLC